MNPTVDAVLTWVVPFAVVFGSAAVIVAVSVWAVRAARRSPRARTAAVSERDAAGVALVRLDDAVAELDLETGLSGALYGGESAARLRRARMTAQHARDAAFAEYGRLHDDDLAPAELARRARRVRSDAEATLARIDETRRAHATWSEKNVRASEQVDAARRRLVALRTELGDPERLIADLSARFDETEWGDAAVAARTVSDALAEADDLVGAASARAADPSVSALSELAASERALRRAEEAARSLEQTYRLVLDAAAGVTGEIAGAREALRAAMSVRERLESPDADRLGNAIREADRAIAEIEPIAARRPTEAVARLVRMRDRLDLALGDARSAQQRLRGARSALPGTIAAARSAVARAEAAVAGSGVGAHARSRLAAAESELAAARQSSDPVEALDAARRAMRHAEDAAALAAYDRRLA